MAHAYFDHLNYSLGDEDSSVEHTLLGERAERVVAVAGSGGRIVPLIARAPNEIICVDISDAQLAMTALRVAALQVLSRKEFLGLMGYQDITVLERQRMLRDLPLSKQHRHELSPLAKAVDMGVAPIYLGRFERTLQTLAAINRRLTGCAGQALFDHENLIAQKNYYSAHFPHFRWNLVLLLLGNSAVLNSLLYKGDFPRKNIPGSTYGIYKNLFDRMFHARSARSSFFLQMIFFGRLRYEEGFPIECSEAVYDAAAQSLRQGTAVRFVKGDIVDCALQNGRVGFVSLSDVPSFLSTAAADSVLTRLRPALTPRGRVVMRGHLRQIKPAREGFESLRDLYTGLFAQESTQLWHIDVFEKSQ